MTVPAWTPPVLVPAWIPPDACHPARTWVGTRTLREAWEETCRVDWMRWLIYTAWEDSSRIYWLVREITDEGMSGEPPRALLPSEVAADRYWSDRPEFARRVREIVSADEIAAALGVDPDDRSLVWRSAVR